MSRLLFDNFDAAATILTLTDSVTTSDALTKNATRALSDTITPFDDQATNGTQTLANTVVVSDAVAFGRNLTRADTVSVSDAVAKTSSKPIADTVNISDTVRISVIKALADSINVADSVASLHDYVVNLADIISIPDDIHEEVPSATLLVPDPATGLVKGGDTFSLIGTALSMAVVAEDFRVAPLDPLKFDVSTGGTGSVSVLPGPNASPGSLQFATGPTAGSFARVRTVDIRTESDIEVSVALALTSALTLDAFQTFSLGFYASATSYIRLIARLNAIGAGSFVVTSVDNGTVVMDHTLSTTTLPIGASFKLRLLHTGSRTIGFISGIQVFDLSIGVGASVIEMTATNHPTIDSQLTLSIRNYTRNPVILFGTEPARTIRAISRYRLDGIVPPASRDMTVDMLVSSAAGAVVLKDAYRYVFDPNLTQVRLGVPQVNGIQCGQLVTISDPAVTGGQP